MKFSSILCAFVNDMRRVKKCNKRLEVIFDGKVCRSLMEKSVKDYMEKIEKIFEILCAKFLTRLKLEI
jgi:hypothetical protein